MGRSAKSGGRYGVGEGVVADGLEKENYILLEFKKKKKI